MPRGKYRESAEIPAPTTRLPGAGFLAAHSWSAKVRRRRAAKRQSKIQPRSVRISPVRPAAIANAVPILAPHSPALAALAAHTAEGIPNQARDWADAEDGS